MNIEQMNLEHEHLTQEVRTVSEEDFKEIVKLRDQWASLATERLDKINELTKEVDQLNTKYQQIFENFDYVHKSLQKENSLNLKLSQQVKEQEAQIAKLTETLVELHIKFKAVKSITKIAGHSNTHLTHAQRKVLAWVQDSILGAVEGEGEADPIPFNSYAEF